MSRFRLPGLTLVTLDVFAFVRPIVYLGKRPDTKAMLRHPELRTERLLLRDFLHEDAPAIVRLAGAREVAATTLRIPHPYTLADAETFFRLRAEATFGYSFAITLLDSGELCGAVGLHPDAVHPRAELGYWIGVPYWGHGYATEAARAARTWGREGAGVPRLISLIAPHNVRSIRVADKLGAAAERTIRTRFGPAVVWVHPD